VLFCFNEVKRSIINVRIRGDLVQKVIIIFAIVILLFLTGCKTDSIEEGMKQSDIDFVNISHIVPIDDGAAVFYRTQTDIPNQFPIGVAYFLGSDEEGWEHITHGWSYYDNENLIINIQRIPHTLFSGKDNDDSVYLTFGEINNPYIENVLVRDRNNKEWDEAVIVNENDYIFYHIGDQYGVKGLSGQGHVIDIQGTGDKEMQDLHKREGAAHDFLHEHLLNNGGTHYYLGTVEHFIVEDNEAENKQNHWNLVNIDPKRYNGQTVYIEKYKIDLHQLEQVHKGDAFANILMTDNEVIGGYIAIENQGSKLFFDLELIPRTN
jgi:hypothetical protein